MTGSSEDRFEVETAFGPLWFWGRRPTGRPALLVITGAYARATVMDHFPRVFPDLDVLRMHLPGNHSPPLSEVSMEVFSRALDDALGQVVAAPLAIIGLSAGALVALGVRRPNLRALLLIDPPIRTGEAWPLKTPGLLALDPALFGALIDRDFSPLIDDLTVPTEVMAGSVPLLPPRDLERPPSLVDELTRRQLAAHPLVTLTVVEGVGHLVQEAGPVFAEAILRLVDRLRKAAA
jgi:pimeloyl-ACP methyl ester carboxylesterase